MCAALRLQANCGATLDNALNAERCLILQCTIDSVSLLICRKPLVSRTRRHAVLWDLDYCEANAVDSRPRLKTGQWVGDIPNQKASKFPHKPQLYARQVNQTDSARSPPVTVSHACSRPLSSFGRTQIALNMLQAVLTCPYQRTPLAP